MLKACNVANCLEYAVDGEGRCSTHLAEVTGPRAQRKRVARAQAPGDGAARRLRGELLRREEPVACARCHRHLHPVSIEVDHIVPLADGGGDFAFNIQILCKSCHRKKTTGEARRRAAGESPDYINSPHRHTPRAEWRR